MSGNNHNIFHYIDAILISAGSISVATVNAYLGSVSIILSICYTLWRWNKEQNNNNNNNNNKKS